MRRRRVLAGIALATGSSLSGCSGDDNGPATATARDDVRREAFVDAIERDDHVVETLTVDGRVSLEYTPAEASEAGIEASISDVALSFFRRNDGGWNVAGLDARVTVEESVVTTWHMEGRWIESYLDGDITRDELSLRVAESVERQTGTVSETPTEPE